VITNLVNDKQYIGVTTNFKTRMREHTYKPNMFIQPDIINYGWDNFSKEILFYGARDYCYYMEPLLIKHYNSVYNIAEGGEFNSAKPGENHHNAKIKESDVVEMHNLYAKGGNTIDDLAVKYPVGRQQISRILRGDRWATAGGIITKNNTSNKVANRAKLNHKQVKEIRELYALGGFSSRLLADCFNVTKTSILAIVHGRSYSKVEGPIS
jgi:group I intron endonuclease